MSTRSERRSATINDVAQVAGVSRAAVSKVIRDAPGVSPGMRERVNAAIAELGYRPQAAARAMRGLSYRLGLEIPHISARFMAPIVDGAHSVLAGTPYHLVLAPAVGREYGAIDTLADAVVDGIIAVSPLVDRDWLETLATRVPVVTLGRHDEDAANYDNVVGDDSAGARAVMNHLFDTGHRRIAHLTESESVTDPASRTPHSLRMQTYIRCMNDAGLGSMVQIARRGPGPDRTREETVALLSQSEPPTAIFAGHDDIAIDVLAAIHDVGRSVEEIAVVGYDNTDIAAHPLISLTSVDQRGTEMGAEAVTMLLERIKGRIEPRRHLVTPTLEVRNSTRAWQAPRA